MSELWNLDFRWLPLVIAPMLIGWWLSRLLAALWWMHFVFKPAINKWLDENLPSEEK